MAGRFDFVKAAFVGLLDAEQEDVVGPAQGEGAIFSCAQLDRRRLTNSTPLKKVSPSLTYSLGVQHIELPHEFEVRLR